MQSFKLLCNATKIGGLSLKNRMVMPAMMTNYSDNSGCVNGQHLAYYGRRSLGGVGLVIVEPASVHASGRTRKGQLTIYNESELAGLERLANDIKLHGAKAAIQLFHGGRNAPFRVTGMQPVGASPIAASRMEEPKEISVQELEQVIGAFAVAAGLAKQAGFDAIEISATTGGLLGQFLSEATNIRKDDYGGSLENRFAPLKAVVGAVKDEVGNDFPLLCRFNAQEDPGIHSGLNLEEGKEIVRLLESAGIHVAHVYVGDDGAPLPLHERPLRGSKLLRLSQQIKLATNIPVIAVGRIDPTSGEKALKGQKADLIAMGKILDRGSGPTKQNSRREIQNCSSVYRLPAMHR